jgi:Lon protease-like protein
MDPTEASAMGDGDSLDDLLDGALHALPIFPLPGTVFFPHTLLPLHVFEPRYRQMTEQVIAGHGHLAIVLIDPHNTSTPPAACAAVAGLGRLVHHEKLPDGRFHILLQGVGRVSLDDELPADGLLYRRVKAHRIVDDEAGVSDEVATLRGCYARLLEAHPECKETLGDLPLRLSSPSVLADLVCAALLDDVALRQKALEETSLQRRLQLANDALATLLLRTLPAEARLLN